MDVQEMSLFELALEAVKAFDGKADYTCADYIVLLEELAKQMKAEGVSTGEYRWGECFVCYRLDKQGSPIVDIYAKRTWSLMSLPGWAEYKTRKDVQASELVEG